MSISRDPIGTQFAEVIMFSFILTICLVALIRTSVTKDTYVNSLAWVFFFSLGVILLALNWVGHQLTNEKSQSNLPARRDDNE